MAVLIFFSPLDGLIISHLPYGPTAYFGIQNCVLRHDIKDGLGTMSEAFPHLIFENFTTPLGQRVCLCFVCRGSHALLLQVKNILRYLFPVPKDDSKRVVTFANQSDYISFRYSSFSSLPE
jgi:U3 small nucleolar ribonucleoprotein protein IMP4